MPPGSCIIATASEQAYHPSPDLYDYAQTKAATMKFFKSLAKQLAEKGIRVNGVSPGPVWAPRHASRAGRHLRPVGRQSGQFCYRTNLWLFRWWRPPLNVRGGGASLSVLALRQLAIS